MNEVLMAEDVLRPYGITLYYNGLCIRYHREKRKEKTAHTLMIRKRKAQERALLEQEA